MSYEQEDGFGSGSPQLDYYYNGEKELAMYKQNHQYSYVMKRVTNTAQPKLKITNKNKSKVHSKSKDKKFNPLQYLNSLIDEIHDHRFDTVRKRPPSSHRLERSSALAFTTPITERTVSSSKVRSKSSYSQYRKKSVPMRDILRVDLDNVITEEDNIIHFTEETVQSICETSQSPPSQLHPFLTPTAAARRIQRAWRKYQTLKVVRKYYIYYKNVMKKEKEEREQETKALKESKIDRKRELERTLKIKKNNQRINLSKTIRSTIGDVAQRLQFSQEVNMSNNTTKELIREPAQEGLNETKTMELPVLSNLQMFHSEEYTSKDLKFVIDLFRNKQENASKEIDQQLNTFCKLQSQLTPLDYFTSNQSELSSPDKNNHVSEGLSPAVFCEMEKIIKEKYELLREKLRQSSPGEFEYRHRDEQIEGRMRRQLRNIERCREDYQRSIRQLKESLIKLQVDASKIERLGQKMGRSIARVRKSYSADTLILKSILEEVTFKNFDLDCNNSRQLPQILLEESMKREERREEGMQPICPTSPPSGMAVGTSNSQTGNSKGSLACYEFSDSDRLQEQIYNDSNVSFNPSEHSSEPRRSVNEFQEQLVSMSNCESTSSIHISLKSESLHSQQAKEDAKTLLLKQCAEEMQQRIENILVAEVIEQIYTNAKMYTVFKPYIEHPFEFKQITDFDIFFFLSNELPRFYQSPSVTLSRFNQKINPNSLEILRLIRDFDFEIDEYELILPEQLFKAYRRTIEESYSIKIKKESQNKSSELNLVPEKVRLLVEERSSERRTKRAKFLSFERDLKIMYMKSVFNCYNEIIIETKSFYTYMNGRSSIGPGELTLALREYNWECGEQDCRDVMLEAQKRVQRIIHDKCMLPVFKNYKQLQQFQKQMTKQISSELSEGEFKWVNYMDEVLQIWQQLSSTIYDSLIEEVARQVGGLLAPF